MGAPAAADPPFARIGIIGLGLIGGSIALAVREAWPAVRVTAVDEPDIVARAVEVGAIAAGANLVDALRDLDLVVLAAPIPETIGLLRVARTAHPTGLLIDVSSTKRAVMNAASEGAAPRFIGTHPMAGAERGGFAHARADLFRDRPWLVVPAADTRADDLIRLERFLSALGARPRQVDADTHDRVMAYVSHLPQILAVALMTAAGRGGAEAAMDMAGPAFREMTRLAASPPELWQGILATNADFIEDAVDALAMCLPDGAAVISTGDWTRETFAEARRWRERLDAGPRQS